MAFIMSARELGIPNSLLTHEYLNKNLTKGLHFPIIIGTTPFSLPFASWSDKSSEQRIEWLKYRFSLFQSGLLQCLSRQQCISYVSCIWLVFLSKGDKQILELQSSYKLNNNIQIIYIEIDELKGINNEYYTSEIIPKTINNLLNSITNRPNNNYNSIITMRVDSDDLIHSHYISLLLFACLVSKLDDLYISFPHGSDYCHKTSTLQPIIWPDPSFLARLEKINSNPISTVWESCHDTIPLEYKNINLITTEPVWCQSTGNNNMINQRQFNTFCQPQKITFDQIKYLLTFN